MDMYDIGLPHHEVMVHKKPVEIIEMIESNTIEIQSLISEIKKIVPSFTS